MNKLSKNNYDFCLFRIPSDGGRVIWEMTNCCNYQCKYCIFNSQKRRLPQELNTKKIKKILFSLKKSDFQYLKITGGEPFIRNDIFEIITYASRLGFSIDISTNASLINDLKAKTIKELNVEMMHVSLDGHNKKIHEMVRGVDTFLPTIRGINCLVKQNIYVRLGCIVYKGNEKHLEKIIKFAKKIKVQEIIFSRMEPVGRMRGDNSLVTTLSDQQIQKQLELLKIKYQKSIKVNYSFAKSKNHKHHGVCPGGSKFLSIDSQGKISPCTWISEKLPLLRTDIKKYLNFITLLSKYKITGCPVQSIEEVSIINELTTIDLKNISKKYSRYSQLYSFTTENIKGYFPLFNFKNKKILTVGGSTDHLINAYFYGAKEVTCFDINLFSKFYAQLKLVALQKLNYDEFILFFMKSDKSFNVKTYQQLRPYLSGSAQYFFDKLYLSFKNKGSLIRQSKFFNNQYDQPQKKIQYNSYLQNKNNFKLAQKILKNKKLSWITTSVECLSKEKLANNSFDIILLSNISDYSHLIFNKKDYLKQYKNEVVKPLLPLLKTKGQLAFAYIYCSNANKDIYRNLIDNSITRRKVFSNIKGTKYNELEFNSAIKGKDSVIFLQKIND